MGSEYFFDQDCDGSWHIVPMSVREEWDLWASGWWASSDPPDGIIMIDHPRGILFENPVRIRFMPS